MRRRVDARDVLDPDGKTRKTCRARILGHYRPAGPNAWDDYEYVTQEEGELEVLPGLPVQLEPTGARFRLRSAGRVVRLAWIPDAAEERQLEAATPSARRRLFLERYLEGFQEERGKGAAAVIARKLGE